jgi:hypothetical protein
MGDVSLGTELRLTRRILSDDARLIERFGDPFRPLGPECKVIQFDRPMTPTQLQRAGELISDRPDVQLYVYGTASRDLGFLRHFPSLRRLHVALYQLEDATGFSQVAGNLEDLVFGETKRTFSLRFLAMLPRLTSLFLVRHRKDVSVIADHSKLTKLGLSGITLPDLSLLLRLERLRDLSILLGGTANLSVLPRLSSLEELFLMRITRLFDLSVLGELVGLKKLRLDWMRNVTSLPSFSGLGRLEEVELDTMKGLTDLSPIAAAPALRRVAVTAMPQLSAEAFRCLLGHPRLNELWAYTGRTKVNAAVKEMFAGIAR